MFVGQFKLVSQNSHKALRGNLSLD